MAKGRGNREPRKPKLGTSIRFLGGGGVFNPLLGTWLGHVALSALVCRRRSSFETRRN